MLKGQKFSLAYKVEFIKQSNVGTEEEFSIGPVHLCNIGGLIMGRV